MTNIEGAEAVGPSCPECGHLIGTHSHDVGCMDSMMGGLLERDRLGFCPCARSSLGLIADAVDAARAEGAAAVLHKVEGAVIDVLNMHREELDFRGDFLGCSCEQGARVQHGHRLHLAGRRLHLAGRVLAALTESVSDAS